MKIKNNGQTYYGLSYKRKRGNVGFGVWVAYDPIHRLVVACHFGVKAK